MALIQFVRNYDDLSSDRGFQFKFHCDKCGNGFMTQFETSTVGMAESVLGVASSLLGGWAASAGNAAREVERAVGGKLHDSALARGVEEARPNFRQCGRCGHWVCAQVCWNGQANLCHDCAPDFTQQLAANQAQAKMDAARAQLQAKATMTNYVQDVNMSADAYVQSPMAASNTQAAKKLCGPCGAEIGNAKFCPECGKPAVAAAPTHCPQCGAETKGAKFCRECGTKLTA
jgi:hypothetical protein